MAETILGGNQVNADVVNVKGVNGTIVGNLNITSEGVASGFSGSNHIKIPFHVWDVSHWELVIKFKYDSSQVQSLIGVQDASHLAIALYASTDGYIYFRQAYQLSSWLAYDIGGNAYLTNGNTYYVKLAYNCSETKLYYKAENDTSYTLLNTYTQASNGLWGIPETDILLGCSYPTDASPWAMGANGELYLADCYLTKNGIEVWRGFETPLQAEIKQLAKNEIERTLQEGEYFSFKNFGRKGVGSLNSTLTYTFNWAVATDVSNFPGKLHVANGYSLNYPERHTNGNMILSFGTGLGIRDYINEENALGDFYLRISYYTSESDSASYPAILYGVELPGNSLAGYNGVRLVRAGSTVHFYVSTDGTNNNIDLTATVTNNAWWDFRCYYSSQTGYTFIAVPPSSSGQSTQTSTSATTTRPYRRSTDIGAVIGLPQSGGVTGSYTPKGTYDIRNCQLFVNGAAKWYLRNFIKNEKQFSVSTNNVLKGITGFDDTKSQVLKNVNGVFTWVDEE